MSKDFGVKEIDCVARSKQFRQHYVVLHTHTRFIKPSKFWIEAR